jgi:outer membrane protein assembly factor BamB
MDAEPRGLDVAPTLPFDPGADTEVLRNLIKAARDGDRATRDAVARSLTQMSARLDRLDDDKWDLAPDGLEEALASGDVLEGLARLRGPPSLAGAASSVKTKLEAIARARADRLTRFAAAAASAKNKQAELSATERAVAYGMLPESHLLRGLINYYWKTARHEKVSSLALAALESGRFAGEKSALGRISRVLVKTAPDAAFEAFLAGMRLEAGRMRSFKTRVFADNVASSLGTFAPGCDFAVLLQTEDATGFLEAGLALEREGELAAAAGAFEKASFVKPERETALRRLVRLYALLGEKAALERTRRRIRHLGYAPVEGDVEEEGGVDTSGRVAWRFKHERCPIYAGMLRTGNLLVLGDSRPNGVGESMDALVALDARTGKVAWEWETPARELWLSRTGVCKGSVQYRGFGLADVGLVVEAAQRYTVDRGGHGGGSSIDCTRYFLDPATGAVLRSQDSPRPKVGYGALASYPEGIFIRAYENVLEGVAVSGTGRSWRLEVNPLVGWKERRNRRTFCHVSAGRVAAVGQDGWAMVASASDGAVLWRGRVPGVVDSPPHIGDGRAFFAALGGDVHAFDVRTGKPLWEKVFPMWARAMASEAGRLYCLHAGGTLRCLDASTGSELWSRAVDWTWERPWIGVSGAEVYVAPCGGGYLSAFSASTGERLWAMRIPRRSFRMEPIAEHGRLVVATAEGVLCLRTHEAAAGLERRIDGALALARRLENDGRLRQAAFAAAEAADRIDPGSFALKKEASRLAARAGLGEYAAMRMYEWVVPLAGEGVALNPEQESLLRGLLASDSDITAVRAAIVLATAGVLDGPVESVLRTRRAKVWRLKRRACRLLAENTPIDKISLAWGGKNDSKVIGLVFRKRRNAGASTAGVRSGADPHVMRGGEARRREPAGASVPATTLPQYLLSGLGKRDLPKVGAPSGGRKALAGAAEERLVEMLNAPDGLRREWAALALARLEAPEGDPATVGALGARLEDMLAEPKASDRIEVLATTARDSLGAWRARAVLTLVHLLRDEAGPVVMELFRRDPGANDRKDEWSRSLLEFAITIDTPEMLPIVLRHAVVGDQGYYRPPPWVAYVKRHAAQGMLRRHAERLLGRLAKGRLALPHDLRCLLGDGLVQEARAHVGSGKAGAELFQGSINVIGLFGSAEDVDALVRVAAAAETPAETRRCAVFALANIEGDEAHDALRLLTNLDKPGAHAQECRDFAALGMATRGDMESIMKSAYLSVAGHGPAREYARFVFAASSARAVHLRRGCRFWVSTSRKDTEDSILTKVLYFRDAMEPARSLEPVELFGLVPPEVVVPPARVPETAPASPLEAEEPFLVF